MEIPKGKYLGTLCKRGHEWEGSGKSLRQNKRGCIECMRVVAKRYQPIHNMAAKLKRREGDYYKKEYIKRKASYKAWVKHTNYNNKRHLADSSSLHDRYIRRVIAQSSVFKRSEVPSELVELKRIQLKIYRLIKEMENG